MLDLILDELKELDVGLDAMEQDGELFAAMLEHYLLTTEIYGKISDRNKIGLWQYFLKYGNNVQ